MDKKPTYQTYSSIKSNKARAPSHTCPGRCGYTIAARDPHAVCTACLGREHVQAALQTRISCKQCSKISPGILLRRAVFLQGVCSDPYWWRQHRIAAGNGIAYADDKLGLLLQTSSGNRSLSR